jgi:hypothetical protein
VAKLEQGIREPTWETAVALAQALGVSCEAFLQEPAARPPSPTKKRKAAGAEKGRKTPGRKKEEGAS